MGEADASPTPTPVGHIVDQRDKGLKLVKPTTGHAKDAAYLQGLLARIAIPQLSSRKLAVNPDFVNGPQLLNIDRGIEGIT